MFDTMKIARKIKEARIGKNMTQMDLADAMGVSYQAVSNWERGNSMPDISKLEDLCGALGLEVSELLGIEQKETATVNKILKEEEPLTIEELSEVAPILPPAQIREQAEKAAGDEKQKINIKALEDIAMYLDDDFWEELLETVEVDSLADLEPIAMYLEEDVLDALVRKAPMSDSRGFVALAMYLSEDTLDWAARRYADNMDVHALEELAMYLEEDTLDALADEQIAKGNAKWLAPLCMYMEEETVRKIARALMKEGDIKALKKTAKYL